MYPCVSCIRLVSICEIIFLGEGHVIFFYISRVGNGQVPLGGVVCCKEKLDPVSIPRGSFRGINNIKWVLNNIYRAIK